MNPYYVDDGPDDRTSGRLAMLAVLVFGALFMVTLLSLAGYGVWMLVEPAFRFLF